MYPDECRLPSVWLLRYIGGMHYKVGKLSVFTDWKTPWQWVQEEREMIEQYNFDWEEDDVDDTRYLFTPHGMIS